MKSFSAIALLAVTVVLFGCGLRESQVRVRSLADGDCRALMDKVIPLCAATSPQGDGESDNSKSWLRGSEIPEALRYLKPHRVYLTDTSATIELWRGAAGDDTIYVMRDGSGVWHVSVHEGDLLNKDRWIWSSQRKR